MFDSENEDDAKRQAAQVEAAKAFTAATYGGTVRSTLTPMQNGQETVWHGETELVAELTYEQQMVFEVAGPVYEWSVRNGDRSESMDQILVEIFGRSDGRIAENNSGLPLENESQLIELVREAMVIFNGSELQLLDMFSDTLYWDGELTAAKCEELAEDSRTNTRQSRALFEAGYAVACAVQGSSSPASFSVMPGAISRPTFLAR